MSLSDIVNAAAGQVLAHQKTKATDAEVTAFYSRIEKIRKTVAAPIQECLEKLHALGEDKNLRQFGFDLGTHFGMGHLRIDGFYRFGNEIETNGRSFHRPSPSWYDLETVVIIINPDGAMAGREAIDEVNGRYSVNKDMGLQATLERIAAWAAAKSPERANEIARVFADIESKYILSASSNPQPGIKP